MKKLLLVLATVIVLAVPVVLPASPQTPKTAQKRNVTVRMTTGETIQGKLIGLSNDTLEVEDSHARHIRLNTNAVASIIFTKPSDGEWKVDNQGALELYGTVGNNKDKNVFLTLNQHSGNRWTVGFGLSIPSYLVRDGLAPVTVKLDGTEANSVGVGEGGNYLWTGSEDGTAVVLKLVDPAEFVHSLQSASTLEVEYYSRDYRAIVIKFDVRGLTKALANYRRPK